MNAVLNIYKDCTSEEPTKQYVCRRLLFGAAQKIQSLSESLKGKSEEEQEVITIDILKTIFPHFESEDFKYIDVAEWAQFVNTIGAESKEVISNFQKK
jgi:hypothetical protein